MCQLPSVSTVFSVKRGLLLLSRSVISNSLWPHGLHYARLPYLHHLPELAQTHVHWVNDAIQPSYPLSSFSLPALNLSQHQGLSTKSALRIRWPKFCSFSFSISPSNESSGLISFKIDWLDILAVQGTLKNLLQYHSSKASVFQGSTLFMTSSHIPTWLLEKP